jgi:carbon storage regulator CsrA
MLVLSRKLNESVRCRIYHPGGGHVDLVVTMVEVHAGRVEAKIGFDAPKDIVEIHRQEVWDQMERKRKEAGEGVSPAPP